MMKLNFFINKEEIRGGMAHWDAQITKQEPESTCRLRFDWVCNGYTKINTFSEIYLK